MTVTRGARWTAGALLVAGLAGCGGGEDDYEPLPPTNEYAAPGASFCADLAESLIAQGGSGITWKLSKLPEPEPEPEPTASASASASASTAPVTDIADGFCALTATAGTAAEKVRFQVALSAIPVSVGEARRLYEQASSQAAARAELNYDARPGDVPGDWKQSTRIELVKVPANPRSKTPVDLHDLVLDGNLHAQVKVHVISVQGAQIPGVQAQLRTASDAVLAGTTTLLFTGTSAD